MSVFIIILAHKTRIYDDESYVVEAESCADACQLAIGAHAITLRDHPAEFEVKSAVKTRHRHVLTAEIVPTVPA